MLSSSLHSAKKHLERKEVAALNRFPSSERPGLTLAHLGDVLTGTDVPVQWKELTP